MRHPGFKKGIGIFGFVAAAVTFTYGWFVNTPIGEWVTIGAFIVYMLLLGQNAGRLGEAKVAEGAGTDAKTAGE